MGCAMGCALSMFSKLSRRLGFLGWLGRTWAVFVASPCRQSRCHLVTSICTFLDRYAVRMELQVDVVAAVRVAVTAGLQQQRG